MALYTITTKEEFAEKVINSDRTVLVDFWAEWCPPCRAMAPGLQTAANKLDDKGVDIVKVNIEESADNQQLAAEYEVQSIPNMPIFKQGKEVERLIGMVAEPILTDQLAKLAKA